MLKVGDIAPEIDATTSAGARFRLSDHSGLCTIVFFFPKAFTPGCTIETRRFRDNYAELALLGARIVGVSTDDHDTQCLFAKEMRTPFPMIGDSDKAVARAYGVLWPILERAMRVTFVVDAKRRIVAVIHHELNIVQHRDEVLRVIDRMRGRKVGTSHAAGDRGRALRSARRGRIGRDGHRLHGARARDAATSWRSRCSRKHACPVRFAREIDVLSRLEHPNIVGYVGHGTTTDGRTYLAMEWLDGTSLHELVSSGPIVREGRDAHRPRRRARARRRARGGRRASRHQAEQRDRDERRRREDRRLRHRALARAHDRRAHAHGRRSSARRATWRPSKRARTSSVDARTDLFALGCLLYRCATGRRPFEGDDALALLHSVLTRTTPRIDDVPVELDTLCVELLAKEMEDRPKSAEAVLARLDALLATMDRTVPDGSPANLRTAPMPGK